MIAANKKCKRNKQHRKAGKNNKSLESESMEYHKTRKIINSQENFMKKATNKQSSYRSTKRKLESQELATIKAPKKKDTKLDTLTQTKKQFSFALKSKLGIQVRGIRLIIKNSLTPS